MPRLNPKGLDKQLGEGLKIAPSRLGDRSTEGNSCLSRRIGGYSQNTTANKGVGQDQPGGATIPILPWMDGDDLSIDPYSRQYRVAQRDLIRALAPQCQIGDISFETRDALPIARRICFGALPDWTHICGSPRAPGTHTG